MAMVTAAVFGCSSAATDPMEGMAAQHTISAGDTVRLKLGEAAAVAETNVVVRFSSVEEDSRCPIDVLCVWEGDAHVRLDVSHGRSSSRADLHTALEPKAVQIRGLTIRLIDIAPSRTSTGTVQPGDYSVRLLITAS
jgi:hypothetical protein